MAKISPFYILQSSADLWPMPYDLAAPFISISYDQMERNSVNPKNSLLFRAYDIRYAERGKAVNPQYRFHSERPVREWDTASTTTQSHLRLTPKNEQAALLS
jgi:hypothetical protein